MCLPSSKQYTYTWTVTTEQEIALRFLELVDRTQQIVFLLWLKVEEKKEESKASCGLGFQEPPEHFPHLLRDTRIA